MESRCKSCLLLGENRTDGKALPQMPPLESRFGLSWEKGDWTTTGLVRVVSRQNRVAINDGNVVGKDLARVQVSQYFH